MDYPLKKQADELASHGRYGDSVLVHMHPLELEGIASLTPGGLTTNPVTGQPEAWAFLIPLLASGIGSAAGWGALGTAALSGAMTAAATGDLKRGAASALMGAGIGSALGAAGAAGAEGAASAATDAAATAATDAATQTAADAATGAMAESLTTGSADAAMMAAQEAAQQQAMTAALDPSLMTGTADAAMAAQAAVPEAMTGADVFQDMTFGDRMGAMFNEQGRAALIPELTKSSNMLPIAIGGGQLESMQAQEDREKEFSRIRGDRQAKLKMYYDDLQAGYRAAQPGAATGRSPLRANDYLPGPYAPGMNRGGTVPDMSEYYYGMIDAYGPGGFAAGGNPGYGGIDPVTIQHNLRGNSVPVPRDYIPGFNAEMNYFQTGETPMYPEYTSPQASSMGMYNPSLSMGAMQGAMGRPYFSNYMAPMSPWTFSPTSPTPWEMGSIMQNQYGYRPPGMAEGGRVPMETAMGPMSLAPGGLAGMVPQAEGPTDEEVSMVAAAVAGQVPGQQAEVIVDEFIQRHGHEVFAQIRDMVLQSIAPGAQTEGMISGPGTGMSDEVPGVIGAQGPVAVSPGEYIVPADVVSGLGDGSSDAGASRLDEMAANVRTQRNGSAQQPPPVNINEV